MSITFRPVGQDDEPFLLEVYAATRADELAAVPWNEDQKWAFIKMQFEAQKNHYQSHYSTAKFDVILSDDRPIGRLYVARFDDHILIIDIALLPQDRKTGAGTSIIRDLMAEATKTRKRLRIYVENFNPALQLFKSLGFSQIGEEGFYYLMEWSNADSAD